MEEGDVSRLLALLAFHLQLSKLLILPLVSLKVSLSYPESMSNGECGVKGEGGFRGEGVVALIAFLFSTVLIRRTFGGLTVISGGGRSVVGFSSVSAILLCWNSAQASSADIRLLFRLNNVITTSDHLKGSLSSCSGFVRLTTPLLVCGEGEELYYWRKS